MRLTWLGHSSFLMTSDAGTRIVTDPYTPGRGLNYGQIKESADIVTVSHGHGDHNNVASVAGNPRLLDGPGKTEFNGIKIQGFVSYHDDSRGSQRGTNVIFCFDVDGVRLCHLGDLGHLLTDADLAEIGAVDVLLIPVGGLFTIDAEAATSVIKQLSPKIAVPMHYKNERCLMPIATVEDFLKGKRSVNRVDSSDAQFVHDKLPQACQIMVFKPAL